MNQFQYYIYILECSDKSYYTGMTNNIEYRLMQHENGHFEKCYTFKRRPVTLKFYEVFQDVNMAIQFEKQIKGWSRKKKEALFNNDWVKIKVLSNNKTLRQAQGDKTDVKTLRLAQGDKTDVKTLRQAQGDKTNNNLNNE